MNVSHGAGYKLRSGLKSIGVRGGEAVAAALETFGTSILEANRTTNLVGAKSIDELVVGHFLDSLAAVRSIVLDSPIVDVGSGAGLPGIPIAIASPSSKVVLFEPRRKRADFLRTLVHAQGLSNVSVEQVAAETAGRGLWRGKAGSVLIRAVAQPRVALELGLPLLRKGGKLVLYLGRLSAPDPRDLAVAKGLGGELSQAQAIDVPYLEGQRHVWVFSKVGQTPAAYPRRSGIPGKEPLDFE